MAVKSGQVTAQEAADIRFPVLEADIKKFGIISRQQTRATRCSIRLQCPKIDVTFLKEFLASITD